MNQFFFTGLSEKKNPASALPTSWLYRSRKSAAILPPMTGSFVFSYRDTTVASWVGHRTSMSRKPLWGATTRTGASFKSALRPFTLTHGKPKETNTALLRSKMMGWNSQRRQPVTGRARSSSERPASLSRAMGHMMRKNKAASVTRTGTRTLPRMSP